MALSCCGRVVFRRENREFEFGVVVVFGVSSGWNADAFATIGGESNVPLYPFGGFHFGGFQLLNRRCHKGWRAQASSHDHEGTSRGLGCDCQCLPRRSQ